MKNVLLSLANNLKEKPAAYSLMFAMLVVGSVSLPMMGEQHRILVIALTFFIVAVIQIFALRSGNSSNEKEVGTQQGSEGISLERELNDLNSACRRLGEGKDERHPLLIMLGGFLQQLAREIVADAIEIAPKYYVSCFYGLKKIDTRIYAIADLSVEPEKWDTDNSVLWKGVKERIFHLRWEDMYTKKLDYFLSAIRSDKNRINDEKSAIFMVTSRETNALSVRHPFKQKGVIGMHLLIIDDSLIGSYIKTEDGDKLYLQAANTLDVDVAMKYHEKVKSVAFEISPEMSSESIRAKWLKCTKIGQWDPRWNGKQERDDRYVEDYDRSILCWIPEYNYLLEKCFHNLKNEYGKRFKSNGRSINILEVGCGTGALTARVSRWLQRLSSVLDHSAVNQFRIVDQSMKMLEKSRRRLQSQSDSDYERMAIFEQQLFKAERSRNIEHRYDIIYGSLIFHFLVGLDWTDASVGEVLAYLLNECLEDGGVVIWADVFFTEYNRERETQYWKNHMKNMGMDSDSIQLFFDNNRDMLYSPSYERLREISAGIGIHIELVRTEIYYNPFNVVILTRDQNAMNNTKIN